MSPTLQLPRQTAIELLERPLYARALDPAQPDAALIKVVTPGAKTVFKNSVLRTRLDAAQADATIRRVIADYEERGLPFRWIVAPSSQPADLAERLAAQGLRHAETTVGMLADPLLELPASPGVEVRPLTEANFEDWLQVQIGGWKVPPAGVAYLRRTSAKTLADDADRQFVAYYQGEPAGTACIQQFNGFAHLAGGVVVPALRRRGVYRGLAQHRLRLLAVQGTQVVTVHCLKETSAPICQGLGMQPVCEFRYFFGNEGLP